MCIYIYVCVCVCIYTHTHTHRFFLLKIKSHPWREVLSSIHSVCSGSHACPNAADMQAEGMTFRGPCDTQQEGASEGEL